MIFNKIFLTLPLIVLCLTSATSTSKKVNRASQKGKHVLRDTGVVEDVRAEEESPVPMNPSQQQLVPLVKNPFEDLMNQENYKEIDIVGKDMDKDEFVEQFCLAVKTPEHYNGVSEYLKSRDMMPGFFVYGGIDVVNGIVAKIDYNNQYYINNGDLEVAIPLALKEGKYQRAMELFVARQTITAKDDEVRRQRGEGTSFEEFVDSFIFYLSPRKDIVSPSRRFLAIQGEEFSSKHPVVYDVFCHYLVYRLKLYRDDPARRKLLDDLVGHPSLITATAFAEGFMDRADDGEMFDFIMHSWGEAIQVALKMAFWGERLWRVMKEKFPNEFSGPYPDTDELRAAACQHLSTKEKLEEPWIKDNALVLLKKFEKHTPLTLDIFPKDLWNIILGYTVSLTAIEDLMLPID